MGKKEISYMFPSLHQDVVNAVCDQITAPRFNNDDSDSAANKKYSTHVMGTFKCTNKGCSHNGWSSKKVTILIREYSKGRYNAVVFNQRCRSCKKLGILKMDESSYVDRVAYRLKAWAGIPMKKQYFAKKKTLPHESTLCEGCKRGVCEK